MTDEQMVELLNRMDDVFADYIAEEVDPVMVASVIFAVAIKQLKIHLTDTDFVAIIDEIRNTDINELIVDVQEEVKDYWKSCDLKLLAHGTKDVAIITGIDDILTSLDDSLITLANIRGSRYSLPLQVRYLLVAFRANWL